MRGSRFLAMLAVGALVLGGCGGDDDDDDASASSVEEDSGDDDSGDDDSGDDDEITEEDVDDLEEGIDALDDAGIFSDDECGDALQAFLGISAAAGLAMSGAGDEEIEESLGNFEGFLDDAPDDIRDDLETFYGAYAEFAQALGDSDGDLGDMAELGEALSEPEVQEASENINEWFETECAVGE